MTARIGQSRRTRIGAGSAAIALHAAFALLLTSIAVHPAERPAQAALDLFDVAPPIPPPPATTSKPARKPHPPLQGTAAPEGKHAVTTAIVAPPPIVAMPLPIVTAPIAGSGAAPSAGAAGTGTSTGAGGSGTGLGSGTGGSGPGGGGTGVPTRAKLLRGTIGNRDYPPAARKAAATGTVTVRFTVDAAGRPGGCAVTASSGNPALDAATCRLIQARFRYAPAHDAQGTAIAEVRGWRQRWWFAK